MASGKKAKTSAFQMNVPPLMAKLERMPKAANQAGAIDGFEASLNSSAISVAPQSTAAIREASGLPSVTAVAARGGGGADAATKVQRKFSERDGEEMAEEFGFIQGREEPALGGLGVVVVERIGCARRDV